MKQIPADAIHASTGVDRLTSIEIDRALSDTLQFGERFRIGDIAYTVEWKQDIEHQPSRVLVHLR